MTFVDPERLARRYDRLAPLCELLSPLLGARVHEVLLRRAALRDGESFLEVGVGTGPTFVPLARANVTGRSEGIDASEGMLRLCRRHLARAGADHAGVRLARADVRALPFPAESFELVLGCYVLGALTEDDRSRALDELRRVLRPAGRILLAEVTTGGVALPGLAPLLGIGPVELAPELSSRFRDVSRMVYRRLGLASEVLRAVKR